MAHETDTPSPHAPVVAGVDGSPQSIAALRRAAEIADALHRPLRVVSTWAYPAAAGFPDPNWSPEDDARTIVSDCVRAAFGDGPHGDLEGEVVQGAAASVLIDASRSASMVVLGSRGHGGVAGLLLGSVSQAVAERAHCPVLIVH